MGQGFFFEIGKKARDVLYRDYRTDRNVSLSAIPFKGLAIVATGMLKNMNNYRKNDAFIGELNFQIKNVYETLDINASSIFGLTGKVKHVEPGLPGLQSIWYLPVFAQKPGKVEVQYMNDYGSLILSMGMIATPALTMSAVLGTEAFSVGTNIVFDTNTSRFIYCDAGLSITSGEHNVAVTYRTHVKMLKASYYCSLYPLTNTAVGVELTRWLSGRGHYIMWFGAQHALSSLTMVKARFNSWGNISALFQHQLHPMAHLTVSAEIYAKNLRKGVKFGWSLSVGYPQDILVE